MSRDEALYRGYRRVELEKLYSHRHRIEGYDGYLERWPRGERRGTGAPRGDPGSHLREAGRGDL